MAKGTLALRQIQLGDNADTSKNFVISVPAVADGTLTIERENGTDVLKIDASGKVTCTLADNLLPLGVGQSIVDVTGSRVAGTTYTNTTGRPIQIIIFSKAASASTISISRLTINSVSMGEYSARGDGSGSTGRNLLIALIPAGSTYKYENVADATVVTWKELR